MTCIKENCQSRICNVAMLLPISNFAGKLNSCTSNFSPIKNCKCYFQITDENDKKDTTNVNLLCPRTSEIRACHSRRVSLFSNARILVADLQMMAKVWDSFPSKKHVSRPRRCSRFNEALGWSSFWVCDDLPETFLYSCMVKELATGDSLRKMHHRRFHCIGNIKRGKEMGNINSWIYFDCSIDKQEVLNYR